MTDPVPTNATGNSEELNALRVKHEALYVTNIMHTLLAPVIGNPDQLNLLKNAAAESITRNYPDYGSDVPHAIKSTHFSNALEAISRAQEGQKSKIPEQVLIQADEIFRSSLDLMRSVFMAMGNQSRTFHHLGHLDFMVGFPSTAAFEEPLKPANDLAVGSNERFDANLAYHLDFKSVTPQLRGEMAGEVESLTRTAAYYHDIIYVRPDGGGPPPRYMEVMKKYLNMAGPEQNQLTGASVKSEAEVNFPPHIRAVMQVFEHHTPSGTQFQPGTKLPGDTQGLNEFCCALVMAEDMYELLVKTQAEQMGIRPEKLKRQAEAGQVKIQGLESIACAAAAIEGTIPFRGPENSIEHEGTKVGHFDRLGEKLHATLKTLSAGGHTRKPLDAQALNDITDNMMASATFLANRDVEAFALHHPEGMDNTLANRFRSFIQGTWELGAELRPDTMKFSPAVHNPQQFTDSLCRDVGFYEGMKLNVSPPDKPPYYINVKLDTQSIFHSYTSRRDGVSYPSAEFTQELNDRATFNVDQLVVPYMATKVVTGAIATAMNKITAEEYGVTLSTEAQLHGIAFPEIRRFGSPAMQTEPFSDGSTRPVDMEQLEASANPQIAVQQVLKNRGGQVTYDTSSSPTGEYLHGLIGTEGMMEIYRELLKDNPATKNPNNSAIFTGFASGDEARAFMASVEGIIDRHLAQQQEKPLVAVEGNLQTVESGAQAMETVVSTIAQSTGQSLANMDLAGKGQVTVQEVIDTLRARSGISAGQAQQQEQAQDKEEGRGGPEGGATTSRVIDLRGSTGQVTTPPDEPDVAAHPTLDLSRPVTGQIRGISITPKQPDQHRGAAR